MLKILFEHFMATITQYKKVRQNILPRTNKNC